MEELVAKRYTKALSESVGSDSLENIHTLFSALATSFDNDKFINIMDNPDVKDSDKESILLDAVKSAKSDKINNFVKLLVEHRRVMIIPAIAEELRRTIAKNKNMYDGFIYSDTQMDESSLQGIAAGLEKKLDAKINLTFVKTDIDGIKVEVSDLGLEINFSKSRLAAQITDHILKAI